MLIEGISQMPKITPNTQKEVSKHLLDLEKTYEWLLELDPLYISKIASNDSYRMQKALEIYIQTTLIPSQYFKKFPPIVTIQEALPIYQITWDKALLRQRITQRTQIMLDDGLIDEVCYLEQKYTRTPNCMKSIGIKETLAYLDGIYDKKMLIEKITINTARLAKRQTTFNNSQFKGVVRGSLEELEKKLLSSLVLV
jgi:tRNA dimethylallyltransferase